MKLHPINIIGGSALITLVLFLVAALTHSQPVLNAAKGTFLLFAIMFLTLVIGGIFSLIAEFVRQKRQPRDRTPTRLP